MKDKSQTKVIVALSGGVDSAVSLALLKKEGYLVEGVFMKNWSGDDFSIENDCPWEQDQADAKSVCKVLGVPFRSVNFEKEYRDKVVNYFFDEYEKGRTPNPDVMCNKEIKFRVFLDKADFLGADFIATGHYARVIHTEQGSVLLKGVDKEKDQSYFLNNLSNDQLSRVLFPIGSLKKTQVRALAKKFKLPVADKKDSQGICFIGKIDVQDFLRTRIQQKPGDIVDIDTKKTVGKHDGIMFYTIGQRQGLGIGGLKTPYYVVGKDANTLYVAKGDNNKALYHQEVKFTDISLRNNTSNTITSSIRYRQKPQPGTLDLKRNIFVFDKPQRAVSPGQSIVFYDNEICLGGGIID